MTVPRGSTVLLSRRCSTVSADSPDESTLTGWTDDDGPRYRTFDPDVALEPWHVRTPEWLRGYDEPVVESNRPESGKRIHAPDRTADEPQPRCRVGRRDGRTEWRVKERLVVDAFREPCRAADCTPYFATHE